MEMVKRMVLSRNLGIIVFLCVLVPCASIYAADQDKYVLSSSESGPVDTAKDEDLDWKPAFPESKSAKKSVPAPAAAPVTDSEPAPEPEPEPASAPLPETVSAPEPPKPLPVVATPEPEPVKLPEPEPVKANAFSATVPEPAVTPAATPSITVADKTIKDQVHTLREARQRQMPYLNKATINDKINSKKIRDTYQFNAAGEKTLEQVLYRASRVYTPAIADRERIVLAKRRILGALRGLAPSASFEYGIKKGSLSADPYRSKDYRVSITQPLFRGGILWNTFLQEKAQLESAQKQYIQTLEDLLSEVSSSYFEYNRAYQVVQFQKKTLETLKHYVDISKQKYKAEIISEIENLNVESLYSMNQYDHETSKQELELAKLDLQKFLDLGIEDDLQVNSMYDIEKLSLDKDGEALIFGAEEKAKSSTSDLADLVDLAYQHRAALQVDSYKLDSARLQEKVRMGEFMPKVDLTIDFGKLAEAFTAVTDSPGLRENFRFLLEFNWNLGGNKANWTFENDEKAPSVTQFQSGAGSQTTRHTFQIGLLDGLSDWASVKEAEVAKLDQIIQLEKTEKEVVRNVKQSYFDFQKAKIRVRSSLQRFNYRQRLGEYSKHRLGKNEIQISEYLQSQIDVLNEATALHKALADYYTAKAKLNHAIGIRNYFPLKEIHGNTAKA